MNELLSKIWIPLSFFIVALFIGFFFGVNIKSENGRVYLQITLGQGKELSLLKNSITDFDLDALENEESASLIEKIRKLPYDHYIAEHLRIFADKGDSIFERQDIDVEIRFTQKEGIIDCYGGGCKDIKPFGMRISVFNIIEPNIYPLNTASNMQEFKIIQKISQSSCNQCSKGKNCIWVDKEKARKWLNIDDKTDLPDKIVAKATILSSI